MGVGQLVFDLLGLGLCMGVYWRRWRDLIGDALGIDVRVVIITDTYIFVAFLELEVA